MKTFLLRLTLLLGGLSLVLTGFIHPAIEGVVSFWAIIIGTSFVMFSITKWSA